MKRIKEISKTKILFASGILLCLMMLFTTCFYWQCTHIRLTAEPVKGDIYEFNADAISMEKDGDSYVFTNNFVGDEDSIVMYAWYVHKDCGKEPIFRREYRFGNQFRFTPDDDGTHVYDVKAWVLADDGRWKTAYCSQSITTGLDYEQSEELNPIYLVFTIDTEDGREGEPNLIEGELEGIGNYGVNYIMDEFEKYDMSAVFFVNVYEHLNYTGENENYMTELLQRIDSRGHEVALHSHENYRLDGLFTKELATYYADGQQAIIEYGCQLIENAIGKRPVAFRGGAYIANDDTFEALRRCGIKYDSSSFYFHWNNEFSGYRAINQSFDAGGVVEFPVISLYDRGGAENKLDIDRLSWQEILAVIRQMQRQDDFPVVQIMFHSFTFLEQNAYGEQEPLIDEGDKLVYDVDIPDRENFSALLQAISEDDSINVTTFSQLEELGYTVPSLSSDSIFYVPTEAGTAAAEGFNLSEATNN